MAETLADLQRKFLLGNALGALSSDTNSDLERKYYNATRTETLADAKRRTLAASVPGSTARDTIADLERKWLLSQLGLSGSSLTNQDLWYQYFLAGSSSGGGYGRGPYGSGPYGGSG